MPGADRSADADGAEPSAWRVAAGTLVAMAAGSWWPILRLVHWGRWRRLRLVTGWRARAVGARVRIEHARGASIGRRARIDPLPATRSRVLVGKNARLGDDLRVQLDGGCWEVGPDADVRDGVRVNCGGQLTVGAGAMLSHGVMIHCAERVEVGRDAFIGEYSTIADSSHLRTPLHVPAFHHVTTRPTRVGVNVWLGAHAVITAGVDVGDGAFIGANAVVTRDVPPFWLAAGVPARLIRELDVEEPAP